MTASTKEFCDALRRYARKLATGEMETVLIPDSAIEDGLDEADQRKINASYIRTVMNRVAEVKEVGAVSISRTDGLDEAKGFKIVLNREAKKKVFTENDLPAIKRRARERLANEILNMSPDFTYQDDAQLLIAVKAVAQYKDMIRKLIESKGE